MPVVISCSSVATRLALIAICVGCGGQRIPQTGDDYGPVTEDQLLRSRFSHRTGSEEYNFSWSFEEDGFLIEGESIPPDLLEEMLGAVASATRIEGTWRIESGEIFFEVSTGEGPLETMKCEMPIFSTGVIRIESKAAQYVF